MGSEEDEGDKTGSVIIGGAGEKKEEAKAEGGEKPVESKEAALKKLVEKQLKAKKRRKKKRRKRLPRIKLSDTWEESEQSTPRSSSGKKALSSEDGSAELTGDIVGDNWAIWASILAIILVIGVSGVAAAFMIRRDKMLASPNIV